jgi:hypothetical protein
MTRGQDLVAIFFYGARKQNTSQGQRSAVVRYLDFEPLDSIFETIAGHSQCFGGLRNVVAGLVQDSYDGLPFQFLQPFVMR